MEYYVYYSHQKIMQLFRQLPESRCVAMKFSSSGNNHSDLDFQPGDPQEGQCLRVTHIGRNTGDSSYRECIVDPNDMYQLRRVIQALRREKKLHKLAPELRLQPGCYVEFSGEFAPEEKNQATKGGVWLAAPSQGKCPALRLLCCEHTFCGEHEGYASWEVWCCGAPLPLRGVMLVLRCDKDTLYGLPLYLAI